MKTRVRVEDSDLMGFHFTPQGRKTSRAFERRCSCLIPTRTSQHTVTSHPGDEWRLKRWQQSNRWVYGTDLPLVKLLLKLWNNHHFDKVAPALTKWLLATTKKATKRNKWSGIFVRHTGDGTMDQDYGIFILAFILEEVNPASFFCCRPVWSRK